MLRHWLKKTRVLTVVPLILALAVATACGSTTSTEPETIEREVTRQVEVVTETEVTLVVPVTREVISEQLTVIEPTAAPQPTALVVVKNQTFAFPLKPAWVNDGQYQSKVLQYVGRSNPGQWDTHYCGSLFSCAIQTSPRFNQLVEYNPVEPTQIIGDLAQSWSVNQEGTEYTFRLHDANWHDGMPVTAEDIVYSLDRIVQPGEIRNRTAALKDFYEHGTATAVDGKTVKVPLIFPGATFLTTIAVDYYAMYPKHVAEKLTQDEANCCPDSLIGSGPWKFKEFKPQVSWEHERNTDYFKPGRPFLDGIKFNIIRDIPRLLAALQLGQVDLTDGLAPTYSPSRAGPMEKETKGRLRTIVRPGGTGKFFILTNTPPFDDLRVRRAIFLALNRQEVVETIYCVENTCDAKLGTFFQVDRVELQDELPNVPGYRLPKDLDIAEAKSLMAEAGFPDGFKADMNMGTGLSINVGELVSEQLRKSIGIDLTLKPVDTATYHVHIQESTYPITMVGGMGLLINDPSDVLNQVYAFDVEKNPDNWTAPRFAELYKSQISELDAEKRQGQFLEMVEFLRTGASHWIPIVWESNVGLHDYRVQNYHVPQTVQQILKWEHVWWDPDATCPDPAGCEQ